MSRTTHLLTSGLAIVGLCALAVACGSGEEPSTAAPAASEAPPTAAVEQMSAEAQRCLDLVKAKEYAKAIEPCELALRDMANAEVQRAYDEAKAKVQQAAASAAEDTASGALPDLGGD
jgi:hypothetical protein